MTQPTTTSSFDPELSSLLDQAVADAELYGALARQYTVLAQRARLLKRELERLQEWVEYLGGQDASQDDQGDD